MTVVGFPLTTKNPKGSAILLYDVGNRVYVDVAVEGQQVPSQAPGATFDDLGSTSVAVAIDEVECELHVLFAGRIPEADKSIDTMIFDYKFDLTDFSLLDVDLIAREGFGGAPAPFDPSARWDNFDERTKIAIAPDTTHGYVAAFAAAAKNHPNGPDLITKKSSTALFRYVPGSGLTTVARAGDPTCAPGWPSAGTTYDSFDPAVLVAISGGATPTVVFSASSKGSPSGDTAVEAHRGAGCGSTGTTTVAYEGGPTPLFGLATWGDLEEAPLAHSPVQGVVMAGEIKGQGDFIVSGPTFGPADTVVFRHFSTLTALSNSNPTKHKVQKADDGASLAINDSGEVIFVLEKVKPYTSRGLYFYQSVQAPTPELVTFKKSLRYNLQLDRAGNMLAYFK